MAGVLAAKKVRRCGPSRAVLKFTQWHRHPSSTRAMEDDLYDEFGNVIGDAFDSDAELSLGDVEEDRSALETAVARRDEGALVPTLASTYGSHVETIVSRPTDAVQETPVIEPVRVKLIKVEEAQLPPVLYSRQYVAELAALVPLRIRNVAVVGGLHVGKTNLVDMAVLQTHLAVAAPRSPLQPIRYTDNHRLEAARGVTLKTSAVTLLLADSRHRSHVVTLLDTPGHVNFADERESAMRTVDGIVFVVDVVDGLQPADHPILASAVKNNLPITVVLNKVDRLCLELRLPVQEAYYKLRHVLEQISDVVESSTHIASYTHAVDFSPLAGNVCFALARYLFCFSIEDVARLLPAECGPRLWGDAYYDASTNQIVSDSATGVLPHTFCAFVLEPLYKLFAAVVTHDAADSAPLKRVLWENFGVSLHRSRYGQDVQLLLRDVMAAVFPNLSCLVDMISAGIGPPPGADCQGPLVAHITKLVESPDGNTFHAMVRVLGGTLKVGSAVRVLGENYHEDQDDQRDETVTALYLPGGRYTVPVDEAGAGSIILVDGIDTIVAKGGTIVLPTELPGAWYAVPRYDAASVFKVAVEPARPSQLPLLLEGLRKLNKAYLACVVKVEESGEHVVLAPGELYMDLMLHDLRHFFTDNLEIKVSDPMTRFSETCVDASSTKISTESTNGANQIAIVAEPVGDATLSRAIELGQIKPSEHKRLRQEFGLDSLAARSVWCFSSALDSLQPNILLDDTLEADKQQLASARESIVLGFKWSTNEGPLCDEPIRNTKFKILDAVLSDVTNQRNGTQIIPMTRRACYAAFMTATPRLLEPIYTVHATCTSLEATYAVGKILAKRRGTVLNTTPIASTRFYNVEGHLPVIESVGLETDIRLQTQGLAMVSLSFENWDVVPGDPLDDDCFLPSLRPVPQESLARDFVMKTRRRKGLSGEPNLQKFIDGALYDKLKEEGLM